MAETDNDLVSTLSKKIDDQARFTRIVVVLCCLAIIGCVSYAISSLIYALPDLMLAKMMTNMEALNVEWKAIEKLPASKKSAPFVKTESGTSQQIEPSATPTPKQ